MLRFVSLCFGTVVRLLRARRSLLIENLALRQQLAAIKRRHPRLHLGRLDKLFWVVIRVYTRVQKPSHPTRHWCVSSDVNQAELQVTKHSKNKHDDPEKKTGDKIFHAGLLSFIC